VKLQSLDVLARKEFETAFRAASKERADAVLVLQNGVAAAHRPEIAELAIKGRLPAIYPRLEFVEDGGLMSYGTNFTDMDRRAATYVDKILKGTKRRSSRRAADEVRVHHKSQSREANRFDDSAECVGAGG
jgi:putative tryptophan/tyrosine transport system substrate-binding protein